MADQPASGPSSDKRTCTQCRKSKVKCDKNSPCSRCLRLGLSCVEQVRGRGRPLVSYLLRPPEGEEPEPVAPAPMESNPPPPPSWQASVSLGSPEQSLPVIQEFFADTERLGRINRRKLLIVLRSWGLIARNKKTQPFFKTVQVVAQIFGLEIKDILNMEREVYRELCEGGGERQELVFRPDQMPDYIKSLDCDVCAVSKRIIINGESRFYNNEMFSSLFQTSEESDRMHDRATGYDVWTTCIDGDDRKEFFESCLATTLLNPNLHSETSKVFKCKDKHGRSFLANVRLRSVFLNAGDYVCYSFFIDPIPPSKYLTTAARHSMADMPESFPPPSHMPSSMDPASCGPPRGYRNGPLPLGPPPMGPPPGMPPMPRGGMMGEQSPYVPGYHYYPPPSRYDYAAVAAAEHQMREDGGRWQPSSSSSSSAGNSGSMNSMNNHKRQKIGRGAGGMDDEEDENAERERSVAAALQRLYQPPQGPSSQYPPPHSQSLYSGSSAAAMEGAPGRGGHPSMYMSNPYSDATGHLAMVAAVAAQQAAQQQQSSSGSAGAGGGGGGPEASPKTTLRI